MNNTKQPSAASSPKGSVTYFIFSLLGGCIVNNLVLELILKIDSGSGPMLTFFQFAATSLISAFQHFDIKNLTFQTKIPFREYLKMTLIFFIVSAGVNKAFDFGVSQPFVIIFRSGSLLISFLVGLWLYKKKYSLGHFVAVLIVTIGVITTTLAEADLKQHATKAPNNPVGCINCNNNDIANTEAKAQAEYFSWIIGTTIVFVTMVLLAVLGYVQGQAYEKHGKHPEEMVFWTHLLPLPMFLLFGNESIRVMKAWNASDPTTLLSLTIPIAWIYIFINCITQYFCINGVHHVTANLGTLTCTFVTTVRKFLSLLFSIVYFRHDFTTQHWTGTALVAVGSFLYIWADVAATNANAKKQADLVTNWAGGNKPSEWNAATAAMSVIYSFLMTPVNGGVETVDNPTFATLISKGIYQKWPVRTGEKERCKNEALVPIRATKRASHIARLVTDLEGVKEAISTGHNPLAYWHHVPKTATPNTNTNAPPKDESKEPAPAPPAPAFTEQQLAIMAKMMENAVAKKTRKRKSSARAIEEDEVEEEAPKKKTTRARAKSKAH